MNARLSKTKNYVSSNGGGHTPKPYILKPKPFEKFPGASDLFKHPFHFPMRRDPKLKPPATGTAEINHALGFNV